MPTPTYQLSVSYDPKTDDLSSSLAFLSKVVSNQAKADFIMAGTIQADEVTSRIVLQDIQISSIRLFLANVIRNVSEKSIQDKGLIAYWNQFLVDVRRPFLAYAENHVTLERREDIEQLRQEAAQIARENNVSSILIEGLADAEIAKCLMAYSVPAEYLSPTQSYTAVCNGQTFNILREFKVTDEQISAVLEGEPQNFQNMKMFLKPKKTVYEGESMWEFHNAEGVFIKAKITDTDWLQRFQNNLLSAREYPFPGTVMSVLADVSIKVDRAGFRKEYHANIKKIYSILSPDEAIKQLDLLK